MSLPRNWVDKIFTKLTLTYGRDFASRWEGLDIDAVKDDWAEELTAYQQAPSAISHALSVLPAERPPTVLQFRELCSRAPQYAPKALPAPAPDPERLSAALARLAGLETPQKAGKEWAHKLKEREGRSRNGLTRFQREAWREALREDQQGAKSAAMTPVDVQVLPPAMREAAEAKVEAELATAA